MEVKSIILATDFSPTSKKATDYATFLATKLGCKLHIIHVENTAGQASAETIQALNFLHRMCNDNGIPCEKHLLKGSAGEEIVKFIINHEIDFAIMGSHGYTCMQKELLGSITDFVIRSTQCPVFVIPRD